MNQEQSSIVPQCQIHNKPALFVNTNNVQTIIQYEFPCEKCFGEYIFTNTSQQFNNQNENLLNQIKINRKKLQVFEQLLILYENNISKEINSIQNFIEDQLDFLIQLESLQQNFFQNEEELHQLQNDVEMISKYLSNKLSDLSQASNINNFQIILKLKQNKEFSDTLNQKIRQSNQLIQQKIDIFPLTSIDHDKQCQAIAFSSNSKIILVGYQNLRKIFSFEEQVLNEITILDKHKQNVSYLQFLKSSQQFVSSSMDGKIIFWNLSDNKILFKFQIINDSQHSITCIKFNTQQNMFVSGGVDCFVKFYQKSSKNLWEWFRSIEQSSYVLDLSFNITCKSLFVCEYNNIVSVMNQVGKKSKWIIHQQINIQKKILNIQSFGHNHFALLSEKDHIVYIFSKKKEEYIEIQQINLQFEHLEDGHFYMKLLNNYSQSDCLLVCGGQQIHILINVNQRFNVAFTYKTPAILDYVRVSEDKKYLSCWERQSNKIHIMKIL